MFAFILHGLHGPCICHWVNLKSIAADAKQEAREPNANGGRFPVNVLQHDTHFVERESQNEGLPKIICATWFHNCCNHRQVRVSLSGRFRNDAYKKYHMCRNSGTKRNKVGLNLGLGISAKPETGKSNSCKYSSLVMPR